MSLFSSHVSLSAFSCTECVKEQIVSVCVCVCVCDRGRYVVRFNPRAFNLLFLNLPLLSVLCRAVACPRFESERAPRRFSLHPMSLARFGVNVREERSGHRCQTRRRKSQPLSATVRHFPTSVSLDEFEVTGYLRCLTCLTSSSSSSSSTTTRGRTL